MSALKYKGKVVHLRATFDTNPEIVLVSYKPNGEKFKVNVSDLVGYTSK